MKAGWFGTGKFALECLWADSGKRLWIQRGHTRAWARVLRGNWEWAYKGAPLKVRLRVVRLPDRTRRGTP
jgi:hypothetical protein